MRRIRWSEWVKSSQDHSNKMMELLRPGLVPGREDLALMETHPVFNFFRHYYRIRGNKMLMNLFAYSPGGTGFVLEHEEVAQHSTGLSLRKEYERVWSSDREIQFRIRPKIMEKMRKRMDWYRILLETTLENRPVLNCFGYHEWAMVYYRPEVDVKLPSSRDFQQDLSLRVSQEVINETVERRGVNCTHYDAMRFFADGSIKHSINHNRVTAENREALENPACVHSAMDLFKIAYKLQPLFSSEVLLQALTLALEARQLDVRASPYDATHFGLEPIKVEETDGKRFYIQCQMELMKKSTALRHEMLGHMRNL